MSQTFAGETTTTNVSLSVPAGIASTTSGSRGALQVRYDAASRSYTVEIEGRSQTFRTEDVQSTGFPGEIRYIRSDGGSTRDYLTLLTTPYYGDGTSNRYVGMGYWQRNVSGGGSQDTLFSTFTYGLETGAASVPRSGSARWRTDIFGMLTSPGVELRTVQGSGSFDVDFGAGIFSTNANLDEFDYITGGGRVGSLRFLGGGSLTSGAGFSGNFSYNGSETVAGTIAGSFYGPAAEEVGASFQASGSGAVLTGAMTGQRDSSAPPANQTLLNVISTQRLVSQTAGVFIQQRDGSSNFANVSATQRSGFVTVTPSGVGLIDMGSSQYPGYTPVAGDRVAGSRANFDTYQTQLDGNLLRVELYRPGSGNSELALTYASFGTWSFAQRDMTQTGGMTNSSNLYVLYGFETPRDLLSGRTGTGSYNGVVYANGASMDGHVYDVGGTSRFDVDFSRLRYSGSLTLAGKGTDGISTAFGTWNFASSLGAGQMVQASFDNGANADPFNVIQPRFFGPDGQEIGATFKLSTGRSDNPAAVTISGVTVAKRQ